jgi:hypothetical protein
MEKLYAKQPNDKLV